MAVLDFEDTDSSGKVTIAVWRERTPTQLEHHTDFPCVLPPEFVVVGGGATGDDTPGAPLTASFPSVDRTAWQASSKSHRVSSPHRLDVYAIGMKVTGMTRGELLNHLNYAQKESGVAGHPTVTLGPPPSGHTLISGGFRVNGPKNLATDSFPTLGVNWRVASQDHIESSPCTITAHAISIRNQLSNANGVIGNVERTTLSKSSSADSAFATATALAAPPDVLTGVGGETITGGPGQFLIHMRPVNPTGIGAAVSSKDHIISSPGRITAYAIGIRLV